MKANKMMGRNPKKENFESSHAQKKKKFEDERKIKEFDKNIYYTWAF